MFTSRRHFLTALAVGLCMLLPVGQANETAGQNPVVRASESVYRLWGGLALPPELVANTLSAQILDKINSQGYIQLQNAEGRSILLFKQGGKLYQYLGHGSGYLISDQGHIITNEHVANIQTGNRELDSLGATQLFVVRSISPKLEIVPTQTLVMDATKDLAVVQAAGLQGTPLQLADSSHIQPTLPVFSVGFPGASDDLTAERGFGDPVGFLKPTLAEGTLKRLYRGQGGAEVWEHHAPMSGGNSGGPLVNRCGQVVGTNFAGHAQHQSSLLAVANSELVSLLQSRQLPFTQATGACMDAAAVSTARQLQSLYWLVGGLMLLAVGGGFYLVRLKAQVKAGHQPQINSQLIRKIVGMQQPAVPAAKPAVAASLPGGVVLTALVPGLRDVSVRPGQSLVFGRDRQADVVVAHEQVSSRHLRLSLQGGRLEMEDLGSLNGSFVNGHKTSRAVLQAGDVLALAAPGGIADFRVDAAAAERRPSSVSLQPMAAGLPAIALHAGQTVRVGRAADNDVVIAHPQVSGHHCRFSLDEDGRVWVEDLQSSNGTFVGSFGQRIGRSEVAAGQTVYLAVQDIAFKLNT